MILSRFSFTCAGVFQLATCAIDVYSQPPYSQQTSGRQTFSPYSSMGDVEMWNPHESTATFHDDAQNNVFQYPRGLLKPMDSGSAPVDGSSVQQIEAPMAISVPSSILRGTAKGNTAPTMQPAAFSATTQPLISMMGDGSSIIHETSVRDFHDNDVVDQSSKQDESPTWRSALCALLVSVGAVGSIVTGGFVCNLACKATKSQKQHDPEEIKRRQLAASRLNSLLSGDPESESLARPTRDDSMEEGSVDGDNGDAGEAYSRGYEPVRTHSADTTALNDNDCAE